MGGRLPTGQGLSRSTRRGLRVIPETPSFAKISCGRFGKSKALGLGSPRETFSSRCSRFKRYGSFLLLFIFHSRGCLVEF